MNREAHLQGLMEAYGQLGSSWPSPGSAQERILRRSRQAVGQAICDLLPPINKHEWEFVRQNKRISAIQEYRNRHKKRRLSWLLCQLKIDEACESRWLSVGKVVQ